MNVRRTLALLLALALLWFLVVFGPFLLALVIAWPKREGRHPLLWLLALVALAFYGLKRLAVRPATGRSLSFGR